ncbi:hypothetical protein C8R42DRAFT_725680 [Lentinula raphanica]|nr:hypothetical protein C8R42DRAFT_725680 [Lentinula raphanica]
MPTSPGLVLDDRKYRQSPRNECVEILGREDKFKIQLGGNPPSSVWIEKGMIIAVENELHTSDRYQHSYGRVEGVKKYENHRFKLVVTWFLLKNEVEQYLKEIGVEAAIIQGLSEHEFVLTDVESVVESRDVLDAVGMHVLTDDISHQDFHLITAKALYYRFELYTKTHQLKKFLERSFARTARAGPSPPFTDPPYPPVAPTPIPPRSPPSGSKNVEDTAYEDSHSFLFTQPWQFPSESPLQRSLTPPFSVPTPIPPPSTPPPPPPFYSSTSLHPASARMNVSEQDLNLCSHSKQDDNGEQDVDMDANDSDGEAGIDSRKLGLKFRQPVKKSKDNRQLLAQTSLRIGKHSPEVILDGMLGGPVIRGLGWENKVYPDGHKPGVQGWLMTGNLFIHSPKWDEEEFPNKDWATRYAWAYDIDSKASSDDVAESMVTVVTAIEKVWTCPKCGSDV